MSLPLQPLQPLQACVTTRGKRRKRASSCQVMSSKSFSMLFLVATLLQWSTIPVNGQESSLSLSSLQEVGLGLSDAVHSTTLHNHRRLEETEAIMMAQEENAKQQQETTITVGDKETTKNKNNNNNNNKAMDTELETNQETGKSFNVTALSLTTCVKIEYAVSYLTSLDWKDIDIVGQEQGVEKSKVWSDVYLLQLVVLPVSLNMVFFGSQLLLPVCTMTAAGLGVFCIFHFVDNYFRNGLDCPMKLALSGVSATLAAMGAAAFVRFGLFTLGTVSAGGMSYLFFDAFPDLDPGLNVTITSSEATSNVAEALESDLSPHAWVITILLALAGGLFLRLYEQASLEVLTAIMGGVGVSYSAHAFFLSRHVDLDRSVVFLIASAVALIGWRFQRRRRLRQFEFQANPYQDYKGHLPVHAPPPPPPPPPPAPMMQPIASPVEHNPKLSLSNWNQLQHSLYSTNHLLQQQRQSSANPNSNEIEVMAEELTNLLNSFQERIQERERSKKQ